MSEINVVRVRGLRVRARRFRIAGGNLLGDMSAVRRPLALFKADRWYDPAQLDEAVGNKSFTR